MYEDEPWWDSLPANIKESLKFYQWLVKTRAPLLKIMYNFYKKENEDGTRNERSEVATQTSTD